MKLLRSRILRRTREAIKRYRLIAPGDAVLIALSGGKDSMALVDVLSEVRRHNNRNFHLAAVHVKMANIDYRADFSYLEQFCAQREVPFFVVEAAFEPDRNPGRTPCFLCSWTRRKHLFEFAQCKGFNRIAFGHHQDDLLRTAMMNLTYSGSFSTMPARLTMNKMPLTLIRPLCLQREADLVDWARGMGIHSLDKTCPYDHESTRTAIVSVLEQMERLNPESRHSLWHALEKQGALIEGDFVP